MSNLRHSLDALQVGNSKLLLVLRLFAQDILAANNISQLKYNLRVFLLPPSPV
jgi:hypothetical protein